LTHREDWRADPIERPAVIDQALPPSVSQATGEIVEIAKEAIEGVREWAGDVAEQARDKVAPKPKKRSKLPLLLVALGLGALVFIVLKRRGAGEYDSVAPDAFGAAVEAESAGANGERAPLSTPGG
jgi:hypothetical protein